MASVINGTKTTNHGYSDWCQNIRVLLRRQSMELKWHPLAPQKATNTKGFVCLGNLRVHAAALQTAAETNGLALAARCCK